MKKFIASLVLLSLVVTIALAPVTSAQAEGEGQEPELQIGIQGNGGTFDVTRGDAGDEDGWWTENDCESLGQPGEAGKTIKEIFRIQGEVKDPEYWTERTFLGWELFKWEEVEKDCFEWMPYENVFFDNTEDMLGYTFASGVTGEFAFIAQWDGEEEEFYTQIEFNAYGGQLQFENYWFEEDEDGNSIKVTNPITGDSWSYSFKRNGGTIKSQLEQFNYVDPIDGAGTFEGWMEWTRDEDGKWQYRKWCCRNCCKNG